MAPNTLHLPNGANISVTPVFGGFYFKSNDFHLHHAALPPGWTIIIQSEHLVESDSNAQQAHEDIAGHPASRIGRYRRPTLQNDALFLSSISNPSNNDFKSPLSPSRQIAMMLWTTLWWYFHQPRPNPQLTTPRSAKTAAAGKPKGEWRVKIRREGIFKGRHLLSKLERMGLVATEQSYVGTDPDDRGGDGWEEMFVTQRAFWQIDPRIFLFTMSNTISNQPYSPYASRPSSPNRDSGVVSPRPNSEDIANQGLWSPTTPGPFYSASHLPTYYPPLPLQYTITDGVRHPVRPKPPRQGETFYTRYVPSMGQYLSFRCASLSPKGVVYNGPVGSATPSFLPPTSALTSDTHSAAVAASLNLIVPSDTELLHRWMNEERVNAAWGEGGPMDHQEQFLRTGLQNRHSFPVIGCWDGKPFGYFEIYWVKEDTLGKHAGGMEDWDRGIHVLVGEQEFRGPDRVRVWMSALVHCCFLADSRTQRVLAEPRVDNSKILGYFQDVGFYKEREVALPHKQSSLMKILREAFEAPVL